jgi:hypothetical protein
MALIVKRGRIPGNLKTNYEIIYEEAKALLERTDYLN